MTRWERQLVGGCLVAAVSIERSDPALYIYYSWLSTTMCMDDRAANGGANQRRVPYTERNPSRVNPILDLSVTAGIRHICHRNQRHHQKPFFKESPIARSQSPVVDAQTGKSKIVLGALALGRRRDTEINLWGATEPNENCCPVRRQLSPILACSRSVLEKCKVLPRAGHFPRRAKCQGCRRAKWLKAACISW